MLVFALLAIFRSSISDGVFAFVLTGFGSLAIVVAWSAVTRLWWALLFGLFHTVALYGWVFYADAFGLGYAVYGFANVLLGWCLLRAATYSPPPGPMRGFSGHRARRRRIALYGRRWVRSPLIKRGLRGDFDGDWRPGFAAYSSSKND